MKPDPTAAAIRIKRATKLRPALALVLGSGLSHVTDEVDIEARIGYSSIPDFPPMGIEGHAGELVVGWLERTPVIVLSGRAHFYEGHPMERVTFNIRTLAALGVRDVLMTNAAGGINRRFRAGDFMAISDHINLMGVNPLRGPAVNGLPRFVDLTCAYDAKLNALLMKAARASRVKLHRGIYLAVSGPSYETPAEIRAFARLGADAVGMSTVPEVIVARQCGLNVAALSCVTNMAAGIAGKKLSHDDVLRTAKRSNKSATKLLRAFAKFYAEAK